MPDGKKFDIWLYHPSAQGIGQLFTQINDEILTELKTIQGFFERPNLMPGWEDADTSSSNSTPTPAAPPPPINVATQPSSPAPSSVTPAGSVMPATLPPVLGAPTPNAAPTPAATAVDLKGIDNADDLEQALDDMSRADLIGQLSTLGYSDIPTDIPTRELRDAIYEHLQPNASLPGSLLPDEVPAGQLEDMSPADRATAINAMPRDVLFEELKARDVTVDARLGADRLRAALLAYFPGE